jgi:hypothetical protein
MTTHSLSKYLCESGKGFTDFQLWINNTSEFNPIINNVNFECNQLLDTKWLENARRKEIIKKIINIIKCYFSELVGMSPEDYFYKWTESIKEYCSQGSFGHVILFNGCPHHYRVLPEHYKTVSNVPKLVTIASIISNSGLNIYPTATITKWGN